MPKSIPAVMQTKLNEKLGLEPVIIVEVQWAKDGPFSAYADKEYPEAGVKGKILEITTLESVVKLDQSGQSQSITVTLSDTEGDLKDIIDNTNIHGALVNVYQWEWNVPIGSKFLLYQGEINGPIEWNSGDRSLRFEVVTQLANKEVGFSPEQGVFADLPVDFIGKPWPIFFGSVQNVPAVALQDAPNVNTKDQIIATDPTLIPEIDAKTEQKENLQDLMLFYAIAAGQAAFTAEFGDPNEFDVEAAAAEAARLEAIVAQIAALIGQIDIYLGELGVLRSKQESESSQTIEVAGGEDMPQNVNLTFAVSGYEIVGSFSGNTFTVQGVTPEDFTGFYLEPYGQIIIDSGSLMRLIDNKKIDYVAALNTITVHSVKAYKLVGGEYVLSEVPRSYYTVEYRTAGPFTSTVIVLNKALSSYDENWENDIYVTGTDEVIGSNTIDVIQWLVETFTDLDVDTASFAATKARIENYPSHFALLDQWNILELLESILFQARCAGWISNGTVFVKYLSFEDTPTSTFTESDVEAGSIVLSSTNTDDLTTKLIIEWTDDLAKEETNKVILRNNVSKYGLRERTERFFIYNIEELVVKSATFWILRLSNIWKVARFRSFLNKLDVETFDTVTLDLDTFFANSSVPALVTQSVYDTQSQVIDWECWVPVRFGEMTQYDLGWPSQISVLRVYPNPDEVSDVGSDSPQKDVEGEFDFQSIEDSSVRITYQDDLAFARREQRRDYGERIPSDLDDQKPSITFSTDSYEDTFFAGDPYGYRDFELDLDSGGDDNPSVFPAKVISGTGDTYQCDVYTGGLGKAPVRKTVKQLQISGEIPIPEGSWTLAARQRITIGSGSSATKQDQWTMQFPVWL